MSSDIKIPKIPACSWCKKLKHRCVSEGVDDCSTCKRRNLVCDYYDSKTGEYLPRARVKGLIEQAQTLKRQLDMKKIGLPIWIDRESRPRYLGQSSGVNFTRSVLSMANSLNVLQPKPTTTVEPFTSDQNDLIMQIINPTAETSKPTVPAREVLFLLFQKYKVSQSVFGILSLGTFTQCYDDYTSGNRPDPCSELIIHMILSIAYVTVYQNNQDYSYSSLSTQNFEYAIGLYRKMLKLERSDDWILICTLLLLQYSLVNPGNPIVWYLLGKAVGLCTEKRYYSNITPTTKLQKRLFWSTYAFDRVINHTLGRPTALDDKYITVDFPEATDEEELFNNYTFKMRTMQSRAINMMYNLTIPYSEENVLALIAELELWKQNALNSLHDTKLHNWILYSYYLIQVSIYRPSPAVPKPSHDMLEQCAYSTSCSLKVYEDIIRNRTVDCSWVSTHWLFVSCITYIYCIITSSTPLTKLSKTDIVLDFNRMCNVFTVMSERWKSVEGFLDIIRPLAEGMICRILADKPANSANTNNFDFDSFDPQYFLEGDLNFDYLFEDLYLE